MSMGMCFSGGGAVDFNNTLGLQKGDTKTMFVTFTAKNGEGERLAYSTDKGRQLDGQARQPVSPSRAGTPNPSGMNPASTGSL
jgi:sucrose-6-phosphate hydrolase SacC (GH32 family)